MGRPQRGVRLYGPGAVRIEEATLPSPRDGEATVAVRCLGVCGSDLHRIFHPTAAPYPRALGYPGHEIVGVIADCPSGRFVPGERVLAVPEGELAAGYADVQNFDERLLVRFPDELGWTDALMCQQLGTVIHALKRFWPGPAGPAGPAGLAGHTAAVVGGGSAGQSFVTLLKRRGFGTVILAERSAARLAACADAGADIVVRAPDESVVEATMDATGGRGADLVVDATGTAEGRRAAMRCVAFRGEVGLFGLPAAEPDELFPFELLFYRQARIDMVAGTQSEPGLASFNEALALVRDGDVDVSKMVSHRFGLAAAGEAFRHARGPEPGVRKVVLDVC